ncbi:alpha/beta fold hydrolase [Mixta gaviniae]|uniref:Alpha/beta hydrolase n=1 Tax=Mixta gaviniae TaxID=665914 RepID=A0A1X1DX19_9GAMM|nr:alpha/beta hydrolase [Mixta gaviniae]AUX93923.1 alpha/beta hydrolase [Mixta gaviniae]ORM81196.1 alpha/beta hydrolase [Mixta gaviniae]
MLPYSMQGQGETTLVFMHYLGGSHRTWFPTLPYLDRDFRCVALNTPGFGDASQIEGYDVASMARQVDETIRALRLEKVILVGHSMTGKVAMALAAEQPDYLERLILVAPSPPGPQPMSEQDRQAQAAWQGTRQEAETFVDSSCSARLPDALREVAIADAQSASLAALHAWPLHGSREEWRERIGRLQLPALMVLGSEDGNVPGVEAQREIMRNHLPQGELAVIDGAGHLMPMQTPQALAEKMLTFARRAF